MLLSNSYVLESLALLCHFNFFSARYPAYATHRLCGFMPGQARTDLANTDRARHAIVSAYVHYEKAEDMTLRSLDSGLLKSMYPDPASWTTSF